MNDDKEDSPQRTPKTLYPSVFLCARCGFLNNPECHKKTVIRRAVASLSALEPEQSGKIAYLEMRDHEELQKLMAMSVLPGMPIVLVQAYPSYVFEIDQTRYAVDKEIAECMQVRVGG